SARRPAKSCLSAACELQPSCWPSRRSRPISRWSDDPARSNAAVRVLLQPVLDLVVIAAMGDKNVSDRAQPGRRVETASGDRDDIAADALPEQARPAFAAKAALREARRSIPAQAALLV